MHKINERKAGDFIDLDNYFNQINDEDIDLLEKEVIANKFLILLLGKNFLRKRFFFWKRKLLEKEIEEITMDYINQVVELKKEFEFIYNPPPVPSVSTEQSQQTIGDEYRQEFAQCYGGYVDMTYLICSVFKYKPEEVMQMTCQDFLFWGNFLLHKKFVENIK